MKKQNSNLEDLKLLEDNEERIAILHNYAKRIHPGLILHGGFVEQEAPYLHTVISYDVLLSQKELRRYASDGRTISRLSSGVASSHGWSNPFRRTIEPDVQTRKLSTIYQSALSISFKPNVWSTGSETSATQ